MQCMQSPTRLGLLHAGWAVLVGAVLLAGGTTAQSNIVCHVDVQLSAPSQNDGNSFACPIKMTLFNDGSNNLVPSYVVDVYNGNYVGVESFYGWDSADATTSTIKGYVTQASKALLPGRQNSFIMGGIFLGSNLQNFFPWTIDINGTRCTMQQL